MTDMGGGNFRVFDPSRMEEFDDRGDSARPAPLRDRLRQVDAEKQPPRPAIETAEFASIDATFWSCSPE